MTRDEGIVVIGPVVPVGRGDRVVALNIYHADAVASASTIRQLQATVAAGALERAGLRAEVAELRAELAARPRWLVVRRPIWIAPEWLSTALAWLIVARSRLGPACDALYQGGPIERRSR